jgi:hypothetical protein
MAERRTASVRDAGTPSTGGCEWVSMTNSDKHETRVDRTDLCEECEREILPEVEHIEGQHELIHDARTAEEGFMPATGGKVVVRFSCQCSSVAVEYGPGSASAWKFPEAWMWADDYDGEEVPRFAD